MEWQPIETAPKDGDDFLVFRDYGDGTSDVLVAFYSQIMGVIHFKGDPFVDSAEVTHWMPLPEPPLDKR